MSVIVIRSCVLTSRPVKMKINTTRGKASEWLRRQIEKDPTLPLVQDFFPELSEDEREFMLTGILPSEWDAMFPGEEEDMPV